MNRLSMVYLIILGEYFNLNELNYLASKLEELSNADIELYEAIVNIGGHTNSIMDPINLVDNLDCFQCLWDVNNESDLGYYWIEESGYYNLNNLGNLAKYFDYDKFGHDMALDQERVFTNSGYVYVTGDRFYEHYDSKDIPGEYYII